MPLGLSIKVLLELQPIYAPVCQIEGKAFYLSEQSAVDPHSLVTKDYPFIFFVRCNVYLAEVHCKPPPHGNSFPFFLEAKG